MSMRRLLAALVLLEASAVGGCFLSFAGLADGVGASDASDDGSNAHDGGATTDGEGDDGATSDAGRAESSAGDGGCPPSTNPMIALGSFCIDRTEVTRAEYAAFAAAPFDAGGAPAVCAFKTQPTPATSSPATLPVAKVDWCDAWLYCRAVGKRLCGSLADGGRIQGLQPDRSVDPVLSEWAVACTGGDPSRRFPYGDGGAYDPGACNDRDAGFGAPVAVASLPRCVTPAGVHDLVGNVGEWVDTCETPPDGGATECAENGGGPTDLAPGCDMWVHFTVDRTFSDVGIRCCADAR